MKSGASQEEVDDVFQRIENEGFKGHLSVGAERTVIGVIGTGMKTALADTLEFMDAWNIQILATDISRQALQYAERGVYTKGEVANLTPKQMEAHMARVGDQFMFKPRIRNLVSFAPMNLAQPIYVGRFDCIFCMNVLIYFSEARRAALVQRFFEYLEPGGFLFLGHAETAANANVRFTTIQHGDSRVYQKPIDSPGARLGVPAAGEVSQ
jgi:chemotaxis methyl-accepting protein methylase